MLTFRIVRVFSWSTLALIAGCQGTPTPATFTGKTHPRLVSADELMIVAGKPANASHSVTGAVTATCDTYNGAGGLLSGRCDESSMTLALKAAAAKAGAEALYDLRCTERIIERRITPVDGGGASTTVRTRLSCQATAVRNKLQATGGTGAPTSASLQAEKRYTISAIPVAASLTLRPKRLAHPPRRAEEVGILETTPETHHVLGQAHARCLQGCARHVARRALKRVAAESGALAIGQVRCELSGERWHCEGLALVNNADPSNYPADAGTPRDAG